MQDMFPYLKDSMADKNIWVSSDPVSNKLLLAFVKRSGYKPLPIIVRRITRGFEMGFQELLISAVYRQDIYRNYLQGLEKRNQDMRDCIHYSSHLKMQEVGFMPIDMANLWKLIYCFLSFLTFSFIVLIIEHISVNNIK